MEILNIAALLLITLSNIYIGLQIKAQKTQPTFEDYRIQADHIECAIKNAIQLLPEPKDPVVNVVAQPSSLEFDYDRFSKAIKKATIESNVALHNANASAPQAVLTPVSEPALSEENSPNNVFEINGISVRKFPVR